MLFNVDFCSLTYAAGVFLRKKNANLSMCSLTDIKDCNALVKKIITDVASSFALTCVPVTSGCCSPWKSQAKCHFLLMSMQPVGVRMLHSAIIWDKNSQCSFRLHFCKAYTGDWGSSRYSCKSSLN